MSWPRRWSWTPTPLHASRTLSRPWIRPLYISSTATATSATTTRTTMTVVSTLSSSCQFPLAYQLPPPPPPPPPPEKPPPPNPLLPEPPGVLATVEATDDEKLWRSCENAVALNIAEP